MAELDAADAVDSYPDPIEPVNRATLSFNEQLDRFVLEPISRGYSARHARPGRARRATRVPQSGGADLVREPHSSGSSRGWRARHSAASS